MIMIARVAVGRCRSATIRPRHQPKQYSVPALVDKSRRSCVHSAIREHYQQRSDGGKGGLLRENEDEAGRREDEEPRGARWGAVPVLAGVVEVVVLDPPLPAPPKLRVAAAKGISTIPISISCCGHTTTAVRKGGSGALSAGVDAPTKGNTDGGRGVAVGKGRTLLLLLLVRRQMGAAVVRRITVDNDDSGGSVAPIGRSVSKRMMASSSSSSSLNYMRNSPRSLFATLFLFPPCNSSLGIVTAVTDIGRSSLAVSTLHDER